MTAWAAMYRVEAVRKATVRATRMAARGLAELLERVGRLFKRPELTGRERITRILQLRFFFPDF